jgi:citrate synthase
MWGMLAAGWQNSYIFEPQEQSGAGAKMTIEYVPGLAGVPATRSKIGLIDGQEGKLFYRGYPIETLAEHCSFEEVALLLLKGKLPNQQELGEFHTELRSHRRVKFRIIDLLKCLPESGHPMDALVAAMSSVGMFYPADMYPNKAEQSWGAAMRILTKTPTMVAAFHRIRGGDQAIMPRDDLGHAANFLYMLTDCVGSYSGNMDVAIAIRTLVTIGDKIFVQSGGGVVHDSDPDGEFEETLNKARGVLRAVALASESTEGE